MSDKSEKPPRNFATIVLHVIKEAILLSVFWVVIVYLTERKVVDLHKLRTFVAIYIPALVLLNYIHIDLSGQLFSAAAFGLGAQLFSVVKP